MKIRNVTLSLMGCAVLAMGLGELSALAADGNGSNGGKDIGLDITNAVQHIGEVKIISVGGGEGILKSAGNSLVGIAAKNFIISQTGEYLNVINGGDASNILGGANNTIGDKTASTILGGQSNMNNGNYSTILGGMLNNINDGDYSTIVGGTQNQLKGTASVIVGGSNNNLDGNYSAVLGSSAGVKGNYSVALGNNSKVEANNSFLWTDGNNRPTLTTSNVFAVNSDHGMVVNAEAAHSFAKLTIGGPLVINAGGSVACDAEHKGVLKVVDGAADNSNYKCFCSCDGTKVDNKYYWHSLYGQGKCEGICNRNVVEEDAVCGNKNDAKIDHTNHKITVTCGNKYSKPVVGSGAYFVDKDGYIYWSCQTDAGKIAHCNNK